ncbi:unnamed protein product [Plasmodium vivax]|uniref:(malaria parasite P. vivax) hypothetical protein n=1 Tax=Plasmodium vivax TaxID=5855 RepID=A0A8S4HH36_PLAVI|nr:unnamed protein product [Plasmodium vivax]
MSEIKEKEEIPHKFYELLNNSANISYFHNLRSYPASFSFVEKDEIKNILAQLARNIELIDSGYRDNYDKRCRDINYWLSEKNETCKTKYGKGIYSEATVVFNDVNLKKNRGESVCIKNEKPISPEKAKLMKDLDDYCEIRDIHGCNAVTNKNQCIKCNKYVKEKKEELLRYKNVICSNPSCKLDKYTIACRCTLDDIDLTFPVTNCEALFKEPEIKKYSLLEIGFFFTPVGSILNRFRRRKYDLKRNIERMGGDRYSLYHSDPMPADSENKRYYIEYARQQN